jgi:hypothetical protein
VQESGVFLKFWSHSGYCKPQNATDFCTFNVLNIAFWLPIYRQPKKRLLGGVGGIMGGSSKSKQQQ